MMTIAQIRQYVRLHDQYLYHVTEEEKLEGILTDGLKPAGGPSNHEATLVDPNSVYLCSAQTATWAMDGSLECDWGGIAVAVDIRQLNPALFQADEDNWRGNDDVFWGRIPRDPASLRAHFNPKMDSPRDLWACLVGQGTIAYRGSIPADAIQVAQTLNDAVAASWAR